MVLAPVVKVIDHRCMALLLDPFFCSNDASATQTALTTVAFVVNFDIWKCELSNFVLFQDCFGYSGFFAIPHSFSISSKDEVNCIAADLR